MTQLVLGASVVSAALTLRFVALLIFCAFVVRRTGNTVGLRDVAVVVRALNLLPRSNQSSTGCAADSSNIAVGQRPPAAPAADPGPEPSAIAAAVRNEQMN